MNAELPLPLEDYQRIYQVIHGVAKAAGRRPHRACMLFAVIGANLLRKHYGLEANVHAGSAAFRLAPDSCLVFGQFQDGALAASPEAFHAWVEIGDCAVDFLAPLFAEVAREGNLPRAPRRMFQKPLAMMKGLAQFTEPGDFLLQKDPAVTALLLDQFRARPGNSDLLHACQVWFARPPEPLRDLMFGDTGGRRVLLDARAAQLDGAW